MLISCGNLGSKNLKTYILNPNDRSDLFKDKCELFGQYINSQECDVNIQLTKNNITIIPCHLVEIYPLVDESLSIYVDEDGNILLYGQKEEDENVKNYVSKYFKKLNDSNKKNANFISIDFYNKVNCESLNTYFEILDQLILEIKNSSHNNILKLRFIDYKYHNDSPSVATNE